MCGTAIPVKKNLVTNYKSNFSLQYLLPPSAQKLNEKKKVKIIDNKIEKAKWLISVFKFNITFSLNKIETAK
jgi:hypothetical protein